MGDPATWYLVIRLLSSTLAQDSRVVSGPDPVVGPITEDQCKTTRAAIGPLPGVVLAVCRKAIGMRVQANGFMAYSYPVFEGDGSLVTGTLN